MAELEVRKLCFCYGTNRILTDLSFLAVPGERIALLGPNGAGKSTLMRCVLGLLPGYSGEICVDGREIRGLSRPTLAQSIAYVPQSAPTGFNYSVLEMVLMGTTGRLGLLSAPDQACVEQAFETLNRLGIGHLSGRGYRQLSGGERQLVLLARALVQQARILVMDEPTANLDYGNQNRVMDHVLNLSANGYTVLFSTHDPNQALLYASRALLLWQGSFLDDGQPGDVLTEASLKILYGIDVARRMVMDSGRRVDICVPRKPQGESWAEAGPGRTVG